MERFIKIKSDGGYHLAAGMEGCIVRLKDMLGGLAVVHAPTLGLYCKPENSFLAKPLGVTGKPNDYFFSKEVYEEVPNPFAHWNKIKGEECVS